MTAKKPVPPPFDAELGANLRTVRNRLGLSLRDVEQRSSGRWTGVAVASYERGDRAPTAKRLNELCAWYKVSVAEVWPGWEMPAADPRKVRALRDARDRLSRALEEFEGGPALEAVS